MDEKTGAKLELERPHEFFHCRTHIEKGGNGTLRPFPPFLIRSATY